MKRFMGRVFPFLPAGLLAVALIALLGHAAAAHELRTVTVTGAGTPEADGVYTEDVDVVIEGRPGFSRDADTVLWWVAYADGTWYIASQDGPFFTRCYINRDEHAELPPLHGWEPDPKGGCVEPVPTLSGNGVLPLPVELSSFTATADGEAVVLRWSTASETNNAGFEVEHAAAPTVGTRSIVSLQPEWHPLTFVEGRGTTVEAQAYTYRAEGLAPGLHRFRLRQVDYDGAFEYSPEVEVTVELAAAYRLSAAYPNPFNPHTSFTLAVEAAQHVRVSVFDALGREVAVLHDGLLPAGEAHRFTFGGAGLPSGPYLLHAGGERFGATQRVVLVK